MFTSDSRRQRGSAAIEFALVFGIFLSALLAMIDMSRWLFAMNSAHEAAREGARVAVVCDKNDSAVQEHMAPFLASATGGTITVAFTPASCTVATCEGVTISLANYSIKSIAPFMPITLKLPTAKTFLSRESMDSTLNPRCS